MRPRVERGVRAQRGLRGCACAVGIAVGGKDACACVRAHVCGLALQCECPQVGRFRADLARLHAQQQVLLAYGTPARSFVYGSEACSRVDPPL